jgi:N-acetylglucosamine-6-phosphate deacetylase
VDAAGGVLTPGFIDLHGHGEGGFSFDDGAEAIGRALAVHRAHGTTRSVLSLVANPVGTLERSLAAIADIAERDPLVLGSHLEGPFLAPGRRGAHNPDFLVTPTAAVIERLVAAARGTLRQVTIAPELPGALDVIGALARAGVVVAIGHTEADEAQAKAAFDRGARLLTHAFNAMPGIGHRKPGPIVAAIRDERVTAELILDGVHVHPDVARLLLHAADGRVALITDAMAAAGSADGTYKLGSLDVVVAAVARLTEADGLPGVIAGSTLTLDRALRSAMRQCGMSLRAAITALTWVPARALGLDVRLGRLAPGYAADAVLLSGALEITELAARNAISTATVARFCRNIGFYGYKRFCLALASAAASESGRRVEFGVSDGDIDPADSTAEVVRELAFQEARVSRKRPGRAGPAAEAAADRLPGERLVGRPPGHHQRRRPPRGRRGHRLLPLGRDGRGDLRARDRIRQRRPDGGGDQLPRIAARPDRGRRAHHRLP